MDSRDENTLRLTPFERGSSAPPPSDAEVTIVLPPVRHDPFGPSLLDIAGYQILRELGRGGMGIVYLAHDIALRRQVALKILPHTAATTPEARIRFRREAETASRLNHPNLCGVYQVGTHEGTDWLAMPHIEGRTLRDELQVARDAGGRTQMEAGHSSVFHGTTGSWRSAVRLMEEICRALHAAHEAGVVHRDLKPGNIMVTPEGRPVVLDFGLAHDTRLSPDDAVTRQGEVLGTPYYMAPEQLQGQTDLLDRQTDVWALGVMLFEILSLRRPFEAATRDALFRQILDRDPPRLSREQRALPTDLDTVIATALEKNLGRRYATAQAFADDLRAVLEIRPIQARKTGWGGRTTRWMRRKPAQAALASALLFGVPVIAGLGWSQWHQGRALAAEFRERRQTLLIALDASEASLSAAALSNLRRLDPHARDLAAFETRLRHLEDREDARTLALDSEADPTGTLALAALDRLQAPDPAAPWYRLYVHLRRGDETAADLVAKGVPEPLKAAELQALLISPTPESSPLTIPVPSAEETPLLRALVTSARGRHREALSLLEQELERTPGARELAWVAANEARRLRDWHAALALAARARPPGGEFRPERLARYSGHLRRAGLKDAALTAAARAQSSDPRSRIVRLEWANALGDVQRVDEAERTYQDLLKDEPNWAEAWNAFGSWLWELGRYEETVTACGKAVELDASLIDAWHNQGSALAELHRFAEAKDAIMRVLSARPQHIEAIGAMAVIELGLGNAERALELQDQVILLNPRYAEAFVNRANAKKRLDNKAGAMADLRRALELAPGLVPALHNLAILLMQSDPSEAEALFRRVVAARDNDGDSWANLALLVLSRGEKEDALRCAQKAFEIDPNDAIICNTLGSVESELGHTQEAVAAFRRATTCLPDRVEPHANLMLLLQESDPIVALAHGVQLVHLDPDFEKKAAGNFLALKEAIRTQGGGHLLARVLAVESESDREDCHQELLEILRLLSALPSGAPRNDDYAIKFAVAWFGSKMAERTGNQDLRAKFDAARKGLTPQS